MTTPTKIKPTTTTSTATSNQTVNFQPQTNDYFIQRIKSLATNNNNNNTTKINKNTSRKLSSLLNNEDMKLLFALDSGLCSLHIYINSLHTIIEDLRNKRQDWFNTLQSPYSVTSTAYNTPNIIRKLSNSNNSNIYSPQQQMSDAVLVGGLGGTSLHGGGGSVHSHTHSTTSNSNYPISPISSALIDDNRLVFDLSPDETDSMTIDNNNIAVSTTTTTTTTTDCTIILSSQNELNNNTTNNTNTTTNLNDQLPDDIHTSSIHNTATNATSNDDSYLLKTHISNIEDQVVSIRSKYEEALIKYKKLQCYNDVIDTKVLLSHEFNQYLPTSLTTTTANGNIDHLNNQNPVISGNNMRSSITSSTNSIKVSGKDSNGYDNAYLIRSLITAKVDYADVCSELIKTKHDVLILKKYIKQLRQSIHNSNSNNNENGVELPKLSKTTSQNVRFA